MGDISSLRAISPRTGTAGKSVPVMVCALSDAGCRGERVLTGTSSIKLILDGYLAFDASVW